MFSRITVHGFRRLVCLSGAALCLTAFVGCNNWYAEGSPQGEKLKKILMENLQITPAAPAGVPIKFSAVQVERKATSSGPSYRAVLPWRLTGHPALAHAALTQLARDKGLEPAGMRIELVLRLDYLDVEGERYGSETITVLTDLTEGTAALADLVKSGAPAGIAVTLDSVRLLDPLPG